MRSKGCTVMPGAVGEPCASARSIRLTIDDDTKNTHQARRQVDRETEGKNRIAVCLEGTVGRSGAVYQPALRAGLEPGPAGGDDIHRCPKADDQPKRHLDEQIDGSSRLFGPATASDKA